MGDIEGYANRLRDHVADTRGRGQAPSNLGEAASGLGEAASGLVGAASGLAGGSFVHRLQGSDAESSEDFVAELSERLGLIEERLVYLEDQMRIIFEGEASGNVEDPGSEQDPSANQ